jgi:hypothetical protein
MLPGALVAGPIDIDAGASWVCREAARSGETAREDAAELLELSGISVNANTRGRRDDLWWANRSESLVISNVCRGGERTSGRTWRGRPGALLADRMGLPCGEPRGDALREPDRVDSAIERLSGVPELLSCPSGVGGWMKMFETRLHGQL